MNHTRLCRESVYSSSSSVLTGHSRVPRQRFPMLLNLSHSSLHYSSSTLVVCWSHRDTIRSVYSLWASPCSSLCSSALSRSLFDHLLVCLVRRDHLCGSVSLRRLHHFGHSGGRHSVWQRHRRLSSDSVSWTGLCCGRVDHRKIVD